MRLIKRCIYLLLLSLHLLTGQVYADVRFISLADIHFDPFVSCHGVTPCPLIVKLRQSKISEWQALLKAYDTVQPQFRMDTSYPLLASALSASKQAAVANHASFAVVLGDWLGHDFRKYYKKYSGDYSERGYQSFVAKTLQFLTRQVAQTFPSSDVYALVGNNDTYQNDYASQPQGLFFRDISFLWSSLIKTKENRDAFMRNFPNAGYYAVDIPHQSLRLIALNTVLFSFKAGGKHIDKAASEELDWLHRELLNVAARHQKALILMHIPPGIDVYATIHIRLFSLMELWYPSYAKRFRAELSNFSPYIVGVLTGHLHSDWFQIISFPDKPDEIAMTGTPAISPIFGNNPGFNIYQISKSVPQLSNLITYHCPLDGVPAWHVEYDFHRLYQPSCHACSLFNSLHSMRKHNIAGYCFVKI